MPGTGGNPMKRNALVAAALLAVLAGTVEARYPHHGSVGFQFGFYHYPALGTPVLGGASYTYAATPVYTYSAPATTYAAPVYTYATAPSAGYIPMMAPSGGCY